MLIIWIMFFVFVLATCRYTTYNENYLDKKYTNTIKGIFIFFVFIRHFLQYKLNMPNWNNIDTIGRQINNKMVQLIVTMFLFYSGYGVMESIKKKGNEYIKSLPKKRILPTWINFAIAVLIFMIASRYFVNNEFSIKKLILSLIGWDSFGNSNWYIFDIIILYGITYLSAIIFKNKNLRVLTIFIGTLIFLIFMSFYKDTYWYNTVFCYWLGIAFSTYKEQLEKIMHKKELWLIILLGIIFAITYKYNKNIISYEINAVVFATLILVITRKINIKNKALEWAGSNLFPLYIYQRLPMMILNRTEYMKNNPYIFFIISLVLTIIIAIIYNKTIELKKRLSKIKGETN